MILTSLHQLYDRLADDPAYDIAQPGYSPQRISFRVLIHPDGTLFKIQDARIKDEKGKPHAESQIVIGKGKSAGPGINPGFLWENTTYMLGYKQDDPKPARTQKSFKAFRDKHLSLEQKINLPDFSSVCRFLESWSPEKSSEYAEAHSGINDLTTGFGIFQIHTPGKIKPVNEHPEILKWWENQLGQSTGDTGQCLITGEQSPIARLHPKIKSVAGAQSAGASIVSFNASAYESYGKDQSFNAPVSETAAFKYGTALNSLLSGPRSSRHRIRIGDTTCVYWTEKPSPIVEEALPFFSPMVPMHPRSQKTQPSGQKSKPSSNPSVKELMFWRMLEKTLSLTISTSSALPRTQRDSRSASFTNPPSKNSSATSAPTIETSESSVSGKARKAIASPTPNTPLTGSYSARQHVFPMKSPHSSAAHSYAPF